MKIKRAACSIFAYLFTLTITSAAISEELPGEVSSTNIGRFSDHVLTELQPYLREGKLALPLVGRLEYEWRMDQRFEEFYGAIPKLANGGGLPLDFHLPVGRPFGRWEGVRAQKNSEAQGIAALWNASSYWWQYGAVNRTLKINLYRQATWERSIDAEHTIVVPDVLEPEEKASPQIFKERLEILKPPALAGAAWLTYRFKDADEDGVWYLSSATKHSRQLSETNRSDDLVGSALTLNDLQIFGEKIQRTAVRLVREVELFTPFADSDPLDLSQQQDCLQSTGVRTVRSKWARWNSDSKRFNTAAPWNPTRAVWIKRNLAEIELTSKDPFTLYGREVLYVDTISGLPVMKVVLDKSGVVHSLVFAFWGLGLQEGAFKAPVLDSELIIAGDLAVTLEARNTKICKSNVDWLAPRLFNPLALGK